MATADGVVREAGGHLGGGAQHGLAVAAAVTLAGVERGVEADRDQGVLQEGAAGVVGVDIAGGDGAQAQLGGQLGQQAVTAGVAAPVGALQLDRESVAAEDAAQPAGGGIGLAGAVGGDLARDQAVAGAAGQAVQAVGVDGQLVEGDGGGAAVVGVGEGEQAAEVAVAGLGLDQEGEVGAAGQGQLTAGDGAQAGVVGAWANSSEPDRLSWSVSARVWWPRPAAARASSWGWEAPSRKE